MTKILKISPAERLLKASKKENFNLRNYAELRGYSISSARLEGTTLGEKSASLKILIGENLRSAIFAIIRKGKVLGAKSIVENSEWLRLDVNHILEKLCKKGKMTRAEHDIVYNQIPFNS